MVLIECFENTAITVYKLKLPIGEDRKIDYQRLELDFVILFIFKTPFVIKNLPNTHYLRNYSLIRRQKYRTCCESRQVGSRGLQIEGNRDLEKLKSLFLFFMAQQPLSVPGSLIIEDSVTLRHTMLGMTSLD